MSDRLDVQAASAAQYTAADPKGSRLASANAGSGKTKVLVDRVTRILIGGTSPEKILCLTYTKAAANEMQNRLFEKLGEWSILPGDDLNDQLNELLGGEKRRSKEEISNARKLFARALETPEGLKVQTIHAFCERILARFPVEAGIQPGFEPIDDGNMRAIRRAVERQVLMKAHQDPDGDLAAAVRLLAKERADQTLEKLFYWMADHVDDIISWQAGGGTSVLRGRLGLKESDSVASIKSEFWDFTDKGALKRAAQDMMNGSANDVKRGQGILDALAMTDPKEAFDAYAAELMTKTGEKKLLSGIVTQKGGELARHIWGVKSDPETAENLRVLDTYHKILGLGTFAMTDAIYKLACVFIEGYEREKTRMRGLDFNDQVLKVRNLLTKAEVADWVLYKLDGGVEHILVDEAQDTAPGQWTIIDKLKEGFEPGDPDQYGETLRTFFAVGDEKQSIYSFQGARPEEFMRRIDKLSAEPDTEAVQMQMSFRSAPEILRAVDAVFDDCDGMSRMFDEAILKSIDAKVSHSAFRQDAGLVEFWPIAPKPEAPEDEAAWDTRPVDAPKDASAREQLARRIADTIKTWLDEGQSVFDRKTQKTRLMNAGDILILVRRRNDFFDGIIRNLKAKGLPVAGADRLILSNAVVVQDLLALTRFVLLPDDDLSLAEVLKSPLIGFSDDDLFEICYGRNGESVWDRLQQSQSFWAQNATATLKEMIGFSAKFAPFEFYRRVLDMLEPDGKSKLAAVYKRLSMEAQDALEAFLNRALAHQRQAAPSLQHFLQEMADDTQQIRREMDIAQGEVRVMTVHGAKGMEAPVVFLPDTTQTPRDNNLENLLPFEDGWVYLPGKRTTPALLKNVPEYAKKRETQEYMRLLYVAMTRAESRLVLCGFHSGTGKTGIAKGSWYEELAEAMARIAPAAQPDMWGEARVFGRQPEPSAETGLEAEVTVEDIPKWASVLAPPAAQKARKVTPSHLLAGDKFSDVPVRSPLSTRPDRFMRGNLTHKLLEVLPEAHPDRRRESARAFLARHKDISNELRDSIEQEVMDILEHPEFAPFFGPGSHAEVSLAGQGKGLPEHLRLNAQIDRLAVTDDSVHIIDFKSNRPPPTELEDVPDIYWGQMAAYREMIKLTHPDHKIVCGLLWTDGPRLMILPDEGMDAALTRIGTVPT